MAAKVKIKKELEDIASNEGKCRTGLSCMLLSSSRLFLALLQAVRLC